MTLRLHDPVLRNKECAHTQQAKAAAEVTNGKFFIFRITPRITRLVWVERNNTMR